MQTLISVFDDRAAARRAVDRLTKAGFTHDDVHLHESGEVRRGETDDEHEQNLEIGDRTMHTAEREVAVDRGVLDSLGHFFVSLFGQDRGEKAAGMYRGSVERGHSVVIVDARTDPDAEAAAFILHDSGAIDVDDRDSSGGTPTQPGVRAYERQSNVSLKDLAYQRQAREDSLMADRAGQVSRDKEEREEKAYASNMTRVDRDRPK